MNGARIALAGVAVLIAAGLGFLGFQHVRAEEQASMVVRNVQTAEGQLKLLVKDPYTTRFEDVGAVISAAGAPDRAAVCGYYNSRNSFGAYVGRSPFVWANGTVLTDMDSPGAVAFLWSHRDCDHRIIPPQA